MEFPGSSRYWENRLRECTSFAKKVKVLEELLLFLEGELLRVLEEESEEGESSEEKEEEEGREDFLEAFVEALEALRKREENVLKAPLSRRKFFKKDAEPEVGNLSLRDLVELYVQYLGGREKNFLPDAEFESLLEERREFILSLCAKHALLPMQRFFEDCETRKTVIATFLILLDLVFRNILYLKRGENGEIFLGRLEVSPESP